MTSQIERHFACLELQGVLVQFIDEYLVLFDLFVNSTTEGY